MDHSGLSHVLQPGTPASGAGVSNPVQYRAQQATQVA